MKTLRCATLEGFEAREVVVEATITKGLPSITLVGLPSNSIKEAIQRAKSALLSNNFTFPPKRITINLAPSEVAKSGSHFDLCIALLIALEGTNEDTSQWFAFGELGLDGSIKETSLLYPLLLSLVEQKRITKAIVPKESVQKLSTIPNLELYGFANLQEVVRAFREKSFSKSSHKSGFKGKRVVIEGRAYYYTGEYPLDFADVKSQEVAKRAALICASGFHNMILKGSPGCGKSMIASRLRYILPPLSYEEMLEIAKTEALQGKEITLLPLRPLSSPHHTSTPASIFGGGSMNAKIGEIGIAHLGELFFDELPHFSKKVLEALREPLQDKKIAISRVHNKVVYKSDFVFIGAMNPCPCGNLLDENKECRCSDLEIQKYTNRLSEPFLERIDIHVTMQSVRYDDNATLNSSEMFAKVLDAFSLQKKRKQQNFNANLSDEEIEKFCVLDNEAKIVFLQAVHNFSLSFRVANAVRKVARTIADLDGSEVIQKQHILEAFSYRRR